MRKNFKLSSKDLTLTEMVQDLKKYQGEALSGLKNGNVAYWANINGHRYELVHERIDYYKFIR